MTARQLLYEIRTKRRQQGMTQEQIAEKVGITRQAYERIENGKASPTLTNLLKILKAINTEITLTDK